MMNTPGRKTIAPTAQDVLWLEGRLSAATVDQRIKQPMPATLQRYATRLDAEWQHAITQYQHLQLRETSVYVFASFAYAQLPLGTTFDIVFPWKRPQAAIQSQAVLVAVIGEWVALPMPFLDQGHRSICVFDFPSGIPALIGKLPMREQFMQTPIDSYVGLTHIATWQVLLADPS